MTPQEFRDAAYILRESGNSKIADELIVMSQRFQWHPVSEIHEDYGDVVLVNLRVDEFGGFQIGSNLDIDWDEKLEGFGWTHFSRIVPLGQEEFERLRDEMKKATCPRCGGDGRCGCCSGACEYCGGDGKAS